MNRFIFYDIKQILILMSRDTVVSRAKFTRSARRTMYLYARSIVETSQDQISNNGWVDWVNNKLNR